MRVASTTVIMPAMITAIIMDMTVIAPLVIVEMIVIVRGDSQ